ncbi:MAG: hypothetical protein AB8B67_00500 [Rickettsiaceae bacterium]
MHLLFLANPNCLANSNSIINSTFFINDLYIEAKGYNIYEAKIRANDLGMRRALSMVASQYGIQEIDLDNILYQELLDSFNISKVINESINDGKYSAAVNYSYHLYEVQKLLFKYSVDIPQDINYTYLVIPIFKQKNLIRIFNDNSIWSKTWADSRELLKQNDMIYPRATNVIKQYITPQNILSLSFNDIISVFNSLIVKNIVLVVYEYFTDFHTGQSILQIKYIAISHDDHTETFKEYRINSDTDISKLTQYIVLDTIKMYGNHEIDTSLSLSEVEQVANVLDDNQTELPGMRKIIFHASIFTEEELNIIEQKLYNIEEIEEFSLLAVGGKEYVITVFTKYNNYDLAKGFYINHLSFKEVDGTYILLNITDKGA